MKRVIRLVGAAAALIATAACTATVTRAGSPPRSTGTTAPPAAAIALCRQALAGRDVVSGTWTTVGDLRSWGYGGPAQKHPLGGAFGFAAAGDPAAWCWTKDDAPDSYTAWGVRAGDAAQRAITVVGPTTTTPSGPPVVP